MNSAVFSMLFSGMDSHVSGYYFYSFNCRRKIIASFAVVSTSR
jgi:hypothetical protein